MLDIQEHGYHSNEIRSKVYNVNRKIETQISAPNVGLTYHTFD